MFRFVGLVAALCAGLLAAGAASPANAEWKRAESERFIVYSDGDERTLLEYVQKLENFDRVLRVMMNLPVEEAPLRKLPIYLVGQQRDLRQVWPDVSNNVAGFYSVSEEDVWAIAVRSRNDDSTLLHEYGHHFMLQHFPQGYPAWFVEGFAEYFSSAQFRSGRVDVGLPDHNSANWLVHSRGWVSMEDLLTKRYWDVADNRETYYPAAWILTHYFLSDATRKAQLGQYLNAVASGVSGRGAMESATGQTLEQLQRSLRSYLGGRALAQSVTYPFPEVQVTVTRLPPSADELLLVSQRLRRLQWGAEPDTELLERVRVAAQRFGDDALAQRVLARAELALGERGRAEAVLERRLEAQDDDVEALQLMARARFMAAEEADEEEASERLHLQGRALLARAYGADQHNFATLLMLAGTRRTARSFPNDNDEETLWLAHELAPQLPGARFFLAEVLIARDKPAQAVALLRPVLNHPHDADVSQTAQRITAEAMERAGELAPADASAEQPAEAAAD